ncbi:MAG: HypC/HybG/HupF family hydrogenase formation chaperone [Chloroflexota bacterium]
MCLAIPVQIKSIDGTEAEVEFGGNCQRISIALTPEAGVGDYVLLHTGYAIAVVDEEEAQETIRIFEEIERLAET